MVLWLYLRIIEPMLSYTAIAWWTKSLQTSGIKILVGIQKVASRSFTEALKTTPNAAFKATLDLPPIHIFIQREARATRHRLLQRDFSSKHYYSRNQVIINIRWRPNPGDADR